MKFTLVVDNGTTVHDVHTYTVAVSHAVLIKCSICSSHRTLTRTPHEWLKENDPRHVTHSHIISSLFMLACFLAFMFFIPFYFDRHLSP